MPDVSTTVDYHHQQQCEKSEAAALVLPAAGWQRSPARTDDNHLRTRSFPCSQQVPRWLTETAKKAPSSGTHALTRRHAAVHVSKKKSGSQRGRMRKTPD